LLARSDDDSGVKVSSLAELAAAFAEGKDAPSDFEAENKA
jgi:hypothetical protein